MIRKLIVLLLIALALLVLGILIWWVGPLIKIGELTPLGSELVRAVLIGLIVLVVVGRAIWRRLRTRKASKQLNDSLMQAPAARPAAAALGHGPPGVRLDPRRRARPVPLAARRVGPGQRQAVHPNGSLPK